MTRPIPLWANLVFGGLYIFVFTGTQLVLQDIEKLLPRITGHPRRLELVAMRRRVQMRRVVSLLVGMVLIALFFRRVTMNVFSAAMFGMAWLDVVMVASRARTLVSILGQS